MSAPSRAELQHALLELRQTAERLRNYEPALAERLGSAIARHMPLVVAAASGLAPDHAAQCRRIAGQCRAVVERIERARRYPDQAAARADVLDRSGMLAKMVRDLLAALDPQAGSS